MKKQLCWSWHWIVSYWKENSVSRIVIDWASTLSRNVIKTRIIQKCSWRAAGGGKGEGTGGSCPPCPLLDTPMIGEGHATPPNVLRLLKLQELMFQISQERQLYLSPFFTPANRRTGSFVRLWQIDEPIRRYSNSEKDRRQLLRSSNVRWHIYI